MRPKLSGATIYTLISALVIIVGTFLAIKYAKGGFRVTNNGIAVGTGLLVVNSFPTGAEVAIDGKLVTATDDTLYLEPGDYSIEIRRDGYNTWSKNMKVEKELVAQTNARLFPIAPSLTPLTFTGVQNIYPSPDGTKILYYTASASAERKNGLYILELTESPISFQRGPKQIAEDNPNFNLATAKFIWSPDSSEIMMIDGDRQLMLQADKLQNLQQLPDIFLTSKQTLTDWEREIYIREKQYLELFPPEIAQVATKSAKNVYLSPDKKRLMYTATEVAVIPDTIAAPLPATNTQPEERELSPGGIYIYDREEDKNFRVGSEASDSSEVNQPQKNLLMSGANGSDNVGGNNEVENGVEKNSENNEVGSDSSSVKNANRPGNSLIDTSTFTTLQASSSAQTADNFRVYHSSLYTNTFQWYPDSRHLFFVSENSIKVVEYDGSNVTNIYSGPFDTHFVYPWPDGNRLIIKTMFSAGVPDNLYTLELR